MENNKNKNLDLPDSENDKKHMQQEETIIDLPDVEDIPGQEHIKVPQFKEFADDTISSDGEEGKGLFNDLEDEESDVTDEERELLRKSATQTLNDEEESDVNAMALDRKDNEGAVLNEGNLKTDRFGEDLDLPESEEVDEEDYTGGTETDE
jgi:hypothetical protein